MRKTDQSKLWANYLELTPDIVGDGPWCKGLRPTSEDQHPTLSFHTDILAMLT